MFIFILVPRSTIPKPKKHVVITVQCVNSPFKCFVFLILSNHFHSPKCIPKKNSFPVLLLFCSFSRCCIHCPVWPRFEDWWLRSQILVTMEPGGESSTAVPHICLHASQIFASFKIPCLSSCK